VLRQWGTGAISSPHGIQADSSRPSALWVTDVGTPLGPTVKRFSNAGDLLPPVLGTPGTPGGGLAPIQFSVPADVALVPPSTVVVADGDGGFNNRVVALDEGTGTVLWSTGGNGTGPGEVRDSAGRGVGVGVGCVWGVCGVCVGCVCVRVCVGCVCACVGCVWGVCVRGCGVCVCVCVG
jgi:hypothetical protein